MKLRPTVALRNKQGGYIGITSRRMLGSMNARRRLAALLAGAPFYAPHTSGLALVRGTGSQTLTRATTQTVQNNDGNLVTCLAGEIPIKGGRRIYNLIPAAGTGSASLAVAANKSMTLAAGTYVFSMGAGTGTATFSGTGGATGTLDASASGRVSVSKTITAGTLVVTASVATLVDLQVESVDAQTTKTAGEYVPVGTLDYRSTQDPLYLSLPGTVGHYASAADSADQRPTGNVTLISKLRAADYTPTSPNVIYIDGDNVSSAWQSLYVYIDTTGVVVVSRPTASGTDRIYTSTAGLSSVVSDNADVYLKCAWEQNVGGVSRCTFSYSTDGVSYTQLGNVVTHADVTAARNINGGGPRIGQAPSYGGFPVNGRIYFLQLLDATNTAVIDFNPHRDATTPTGTITSSTTGEVWTINGASSIVRNQNYWGAGVDGVKWFSTDISGNPIAAATLDGAEVWPAATTLTKKSTEFSDAAWTTASATVVQNRAGADGGAASGWTITDSSGAASQERGQLSNITSETYTDSYLVAKTSGAQSSYPVVYANQGTNIALATVDTTNGTATIWTAYTGLTIVTSSARCTSYNDFFWLVELTYLGNATAVWVQSFVPAATSNPSQSTGTVDATVQGSSGCFDAQRELGAFASPRINNTSAVGSATRNASVISCPTASNIASAAGFIALEYTPDHAPSGTVYLWGTYVDANNSTAILHDATNLIFRKRIAGVNYDATIANAFTSGTTYKMAASWGASGTNIALSGTLGTGHANTTAAQIGTTMQTGADGNSASQPGMAIKNVYIGQRELSTADRILVTL